MAILIHVIIALASVAFTTFLYFRPSNGGLKFSYLLVALTLVTGTFLIVSQPAHMVQACVSGLTYVVAVTFGLVLVKRKLAVANTQSE